MKLSHLHVVVAIAEQGSIRSAARSLGISQPALTRNLADLERDLGASLFERRPRGVVPTALGRLFIRRAVAIVQEVRRARDEVEQFGGASSGTVTAGLSIAAHLAFLPAALRPFTRRFPLAKLQIIEGFYPTLEPGLRDGSVDFYLGVDPGQHVAPELSRKVLFENRRTVLCRVDHPLSKATTLAELSGASWATNSIMLADEHEVSLIFDRHGLAAPRVALRSQSALTLMVSLLNSDLLSMVPVQWNDFALARGMLATIKLHEELEAPPIVLIKRADSILTPAAIHFLDLLQRSPIQMQPPAGGMETIPPANGALGGRGRLRARHG